jgi:hypothetical protein
MNMDRKNSEADSNGSSSLYLLLAGIVLFLVGCLFAMDQEDVWSQVGAAASIALGAGLLIAGIFSKNNL